LSLFKDKIKKALAKNKNSLNEYKNGPTVFLLKKYKKDPKNDNKDLIGPFCNVLGIFCILLGKNRWAIFVFIKWIFVFSKRVFNMILYLMELLLVLNGCLNFMR
jgi:hypothetical protein